MTLKRFAPELIFDPIVGMDEVENRKPAPDGLLQILKREREIDLCWRYAWTMRAAPGPRACGLSGLPRRRIRSYLDLVFLFQAEGAFAIVDDINYLEEVFAL